MAIDVERVLVRSDRVLFDVRIEPPSVQVTTPALIACVQKVFPAIGQHACVNDKGDTFGCVMCQTSLPHLLEHLVIELQMRMMQKSAAKSGTNAAPLKEETYHQHFFEQQDRGKECWQQEVSPLSPVFLGTTEWVDKKAGRARIEVSFYDDMVVLSAFFYAVRFLEDLLGENTRAH